jgi:hypothetical protein
VLNSVSRLMKSGKSFRLPERRRKKDWPTTFSRAVTALFAVLAITGTPAVAAYAAQQASVSAGNDVSYPQCGKTLPSGQAFGIVAVNEGLPNNTNPCLAAEISWAQISSGGTRQPKASLYVNTADPGNHGVTDWPTNNNDPVFGNHAADPYGRCAGGNSQACAWQYGWDMALMDARTRGVQSPGSYRWWLDIETANSWESSAPNNRADLEGMTSYFRHIGAKVGIYSTASQWNPIVGTVRPGSPLYRLPDWRPGAKALAQAKKNCHLAPLTGGGTVTVTQWKTPSANSDFSCPAPPAKAKVKRS